MVSGMNKRLTLNAPYPVCQAKPVGEGNVSLTHLDELPLISRIPSAMEIDEGNDIKMWTWSAVPPNSQGFHPIIA